MDKPLITALLVVHDFLATGLLIAITWQAIAAWMKNQPHGRLGRTAVWNKPALANVITPLFLAVIGLGGLLYPAYRSSIRPFLELHNLRAANGAFEIKEHFAALALLTLPAYRTVWMGESDHGNLGSRRALTTLLCAIVWWNFFVGHLMNYVTGIFP